MSNWPIVAASRTEAIGAGTGEGTTITSGAVNTKGTATTIGTTGFAWSGFVLFANVSSGTNNVRRRLDIIINTGGSDQVLVADLYIEGPSNVYTSYSWNLPIAVPAGATIKARFQASSSSLDMEIYILGYAKDFPGEPGASRGVSCTDWTNSDPANSVTLTGNSFTAWTEIQASTPARISKLYLHSAFLGDVSRTATILLVEIAVGAAGSETAIGSYMDKCNAVGFYNSDTKVLPCDIPAGSRLSFRAQCSVSTAADNFAVAALGLAA